MKWMATYAAAAALIVLVSPACSPGSGTGGGAEDQAGTADMAGGDALLEINAPDAAADLQDARPDLAADLAEVFDAGVDLNDAGTDLPDEAAEATEDITDAAGEADGEPEIPLVLPQPVEKDPPSNT